ncbi:MULTISPECIES: hypothetical protein [unclassified Deinococcus]|uniref:hypothetical protein n=1 Tax=unclassified Deinococcus TaxID=2623546 RepID=UPI001C2FDBE0|nr:MULTISPECIES: hypothetical protein [unclassified Deinococcus]MDK2014359.1 hypothetical protein [Deinococcus sp. 43]
MSTFTWLTSALVLLTGSAIAAPTFQPGDRGLVWWVWALTAPEDRDPVSDLTGEDCGVQQVHPFWFLAGTYENGTAIKRTCTITGSKPLFLPIINTYGSNRSRVVCERQRRAIDANVSSVTTRQATLDGKDISGAIKRDATPECRNLFGAEIWFASDGYWLELPPLSRGTHVLTFNAEMNGFRQNVTYTLIQK